MVKNSRIEIRVSSEDKEVLAKLAKDQGLTLSEYLIKAGLNWNKKLSTKLSQKKILAN